MTGAAIYNLVNSIVRIYPQKAAQGKTLPLATYTVKREPQNDMNGTATAARDRVRITVHAKTYDEVETLTTAIVAALDFYSGTAAGVSIINIRYITSDDLYQDEPEVHAKYIDFDVWVNL